MEHKAVQSSNIATVGHDGKDLHVTFKPGHRYIYKDVPPHEHESLLGTTSVGSYFNTHIKNNYSYEKA